jgi:hypothetical protein
MDRVLVRAFIESRIERLPWCGCWVWMGAMHESGYGQTSVRGRFERAHRVAYEAFVAPVPPGLYVLHRCDVTLCVNPAHLYAGTQRENIRDCINRRRFRAGWHNAVKTHCKRGHEFSEENTGRDARGMRFCRACSNARSIAYQRRIQREEQCRST